MLPACHLSISVFITLSVSSSPPSHSLTPLTLSLPVFEVPYIFAQLFVKVKVFPAHSVLALISWVSLMFSWTPSASHQGLSSSTSLSFSLSISHSRWAEHSVFPVTLNLPRNQEQFVNQRFYWKHKKHLNAIRFLPNKNTHAHQNLYEAFYLCFQ